MAQDADETKQHSSVLVHGHFASGQTQPSHTNSQYYFIPTSFCDGHSL